jgi:HD superfamily phosphohydrolase
MQSVLKVTNKDVIVKDIVYRFVHVPPLCQKFMDTAEFNRLRNIKQLGLSYIVYPSAVHTRFEHSLGVMELAGRVAKHLFQHFTEREKELLQLAALFHDAGHVAFSHLMDYILEEKGFSKDIAHHENRSISILKQINSRLNLLTEREIGMIADMILGKHEGKDKPFLYQIVSNKLCGIDVDRMDYLQRDLKHVDMPCFQADYILECMKVDDRGNLAFRHKAEEELRSLFEARRRLLLLVCRHKGVLNAEKLIREALSSLNITEEWFRKNWIGVDDCYMLCEIRRNRPDIVERLYERKWPEVTEDEQKKYLSCVERDDIEDQIKRINWVG